MESTRARGELGPACTKCELSKVWCGTRWLCRPCQAKANRDRRAGLSEEQLAVETRRANDRRNERRLRWTPEQREAANAKTAKWRSANREQHREGSRASYRRRAAEVRDAKAREYAADPTVFMARNLVRKARLRNAVCGHGPGCVSAEFLLSLHADPCRYCGAKAEDADHFVPVSGGGLHCRDNLVPACGPCNGSKYNHDPIEWMRSRAG